MTVPGTCGFMKNDRCRLLSKVSKYVIDQLQKWLSGHIYQARDTSFNIPNMGKTKVGKVS